MVSCVDPAELAFSELGLDFFRCIWYSSCISKVEFDDISEAMSCVLLSSAKREASPVSVALGIFGSRNRPNRDRRVFSCWSGVLPDERAWMTLSKYFCILVENSVLPISTDRYTVIEAISTPMQASACKKKTCHGVSRVSL